MLEYNLIHSHNFLFTLINFLKHTIRFFSRMGQEGIKTTLDGNITQLFNSFSFTKCSLFMKSHKSKQKVVFSVEFHKQLATIANHKQFSEAGQAEKQPLD